MGGGGGGGGVQDFEKGIWLNKLAPEQGWFRILNHNSLTKRS